MDSSPENFEFGSDYNKENDYEYIKTLGTGAYGKVVAARHKKTGRVFAK